MKKHRKKQRLNLILVLSFTIAVTSASFACQLPGEDEPMTQTQNKVRAPEFPPGLDWINTREPLSLADLRGKVVVLDFWTYCCINCIHIMPDLKKLEEKYADELVVIGVHSAKFSTEQETENIRQAILRYELEHPVVNDNEMIIWRDYAVRAWPTLMLVDPEGYVVGYHSGEGVYSVFDEAIGRLIKEFDAKGKINREALNLIDPELLTQPRSLFRFPGKVLADEKSGRLFVADSNHNRIVVLDLKDHSVLDIAGSGSAGAKDGNFAEATFDKPQGMALAGDTLYVADTENHNIRKLDLKNKSVETIAGTGKQARGFNQPGNGLEAALNSPWDLELIGNTLFIANAGSHQLWKLDLKSGYVEPHAGSGRENRTDGPLRSAALAQPSGLTSDAENLYFADSEVSAIRSASIDPDGSVKTVAGGELFTFGDVDAVGTNARFQHPLGVVHKDGFLYVADTYNNKIRKINLKDNSVSTLFGSGKEGRMDGSGGAVYFDEPGGLSLAGDKLYIADTNNHIIRIADLSSGSVETIMPKQLQMLTNFSSENNELTATVLKEAEVSDEGFQLEIDFNFPEGHKLNDEAPARVTVSSGENQQNIAVEQLPVTIDIAPNTDVNSISFSYAIYYCTTENEGLCFFTEGRVVQPLKPAENGQSKLSVTVPVMAK